jgi:DNA polymerase-4
MKKIIFLADMEAFYASVEVARNPALKGKPVIVCGDPKKRHGIALAASKEAKVFGIKTGMPSWECINLCPKAVFVRPHMSIYIEVSLQITEIFEQFTDRIFTYSIDEQFLDMTGCEGLFGTPWEMALKINKKVLEETGIRSRIGIGENPLQAKMACDQFAKKNQHGIFELLSQSYANYCWPLPIRDLFGVGSRMERNFHWIGIFTIGDLAKRPRDAIKKRWGINGEVLWLNAHGIDYSNIETEQTDERKGVGHSMTLPRDYKKQKEIEVVLLELTEEVCRRARRLGKVGKVLGVYCRGSGFETPTGFYKQQKMMEPTAATMEVYEYVLRIFEFFWDRKPVRAVGIGLDDLVTPNEVQLNLFRDRIKEMTLNSVMDKIRERYGSTSVFRASSLADGGQLFDRANKIGGHEA